MSPLLCSQIFRHPITNQIARSSCGRDHDKSLAHGRLSACGADGSGGDVGVNPA
jgi:hypothetical protein